jgi:hypothetical protein
MGNIILVISSSNDRMRVAAKNGAADNDTPTAGHNTPANPNDPTDIYEEVLQTASLINHAMLAGGKQINSISFISCGEFYFCSLPCCLSLLLLLSHTLFLYAHLVLQIPFFAFTIARTGQPAELDT